MKESNGLKLAIRYSIVPCQKGLCGPTDRKKIKKLISFLVGKKISEKLIRKILEEFAGTSPFYSAIARKNKLSDPLDYRIVEAYWLGNDLLKNSVKLHHSFSVYHLYRADILANGQKFTDELRDKCRIIWGRVEKAFPNHLIISYRPIVKNKRGKWMMTKSKSIEIKRDRNILPEKVKVGDWVSAHWGYAIQLLNQRQVRNLRKYTLANMRFERAT